MFRNNIAYKGICTIILFITMGISQVSILIQNVETDAGTLDIHMTNTAGCSYCDDNLYNTKTLCEANGNNTVGGVWTFDASIDKTTCESSTTNGDYFDGEVKGAQFYIKGITMTGVSGGTAEDYFSCQNCGYVNTNSETGKILAASFGSSVIPAGSGVLTTITFSNVVDSVCFVKSGCVDDYDNDGDTPKTIKYNVDSCSGISTENILSDKNSNDINTDWGDCVIIDCMGVLNGSSVEDNCGTCDADATNDCVQDCAGEWGGSAVDTNGDGVCDLAISQIGSNLPEEFSISQNFPNPFNPVTSIAFDVAKMDELSLVVYDLTGKEVVTLVSGTYAPGTYNVEWNAVNNAGDDIVSGMYIYRYISSEKAITRKMLYLK